VRNREYRDFHDPPLALPNGPQARGGGSLWRRGTRTILVSLEDWLRSTAAGRMLAWGTDATAGVACCQKSFNSCKLKDGTGDFEFFCQLPPSHIAVAIKQHTRPSPPDSPFSQSVEFRFRIPEQASNLPSRVGLLLTVDLLDWLHPWDDKTSPLNRPSALGCLPPTTPIPIPPTFSFPFL
jgi:hypothetical protein